MARGLNDDHISRTTDALGVADFGLIHPGNHSFQASVDWNRGTLSGSGYLTVEPGSQVNHRIVCPKKALEPVPLRVRCDWPADLEKEGLVVCAPFSFMGIQKDELSWSLSHGPTASTHSVLFGPGPSVREIVEGFGLYLWATDSRPALRADMLADELRIINEPGEGLRWERGTYWLSELIVLRPLVPPVAGAGRTQFEIVVRCYPERSGVDTYVFLREPPTEDEIRNRIRNFMGGGRTQIGHSGLALPRQSWNALNGGFDGSLTA